MQNLKRIAKGCEFFEDVISENCYYVDKTAFLKTLLDEDQSSVLLITRPRRFGKTLTLTTARSFLSINSEDPGNTARQKELFRNTAVYQDQDFCRRFMGQYPVVFMSLKSVSGNNFKQAFLSFADLLYGVAIQFEYLLSSDRLGELEKKLIKLSFDYDKLHDADNPNILKDFLKNLCLCLRSHFRIKPIILIDEYDVPLNKAEANGYYDDMVVLIRDFLGNALKTNGDIKKAILTGCLRVSKESIFTGLNNFAVNTVIDSDPNFKAAIGFTEPEVDELLKYYGLDGYKALVKSSYDGYSFGGTEMYCPWDVLFFVDAGYKLIRNNEAHKIKAANFWINSSGNDIIDEFMGFITPENAQSMQRLVNGESIQAAINEALSYRDLHKHDINDFWTIMLFTGYLTIDDGYPYANDNKFYVRIPNQKVRECFEQRILNFYRENPAVRKSSTDLVNAFITGNTGQICSILMNVMQTFLSVRDPATKSPQENYYHGLLNGLLINSSSLTRNYASNHESGDGYPDITFQSADFKTGVVIELKYCSDYAHMQDLAARAISEQIDAKNYDANFTSDPNVRQILNYGICFCKKNCVVEVAKVIPEH